METSEFHRKSLIHHNTQFIASLEVNSNDAKENTLNGFKTYTLKKKK